MMLPIKFQFIWESSFRGEDLFRNQPIRNKNCLWWPWLLMDQDKMSNLYRGHSIDASYQVSVHMVEGFQKRRLKCEKLTDDKWWQKLTLPLARRAKNWINSWIIFINDIIDDQGNISEVLILQNLICKQNIWMI